MKILFLLQTHTNKSQIQNLVDKLTSPYSQIIISHDYKASNLGKIEGAEVIPRKAVGVRGDWSLVEDYLNALDFVLDSGIKFDWLVNLSGQDLPIRPLSELYKLFSTSSVDGYLHYFPAFESSAEWGVRESIIRYQYQYNWTEKQVGKVERAIIKPFKALINNSQPYIRLETSYALMWGRKTETPFNKEFKCYAGSFFKTINYKAARYLQNFYKSRLDIVEFYKKTCNADESFIQTALVNNKELKFDTNNLMFYDFDNTKHGRPATLGMKHFDKLLNNEKCYFARKFDPNYDSQVIKAVEQLL